MSTAFSTGTDQPKKLVLCDFVFYSPITPSRQGIEAPWTVLHLVVHYILDGNRIRIHKPKKYSLQNQLIELHCVGNAYQMQSQSLGNVPFCYKRSWISKAQHWIWFFQVSATIMCNLAKNFIGWAWLDSCHLLFSFLKTFNVGSGAQHPSLFFLPFCFIFFQKRWTLKQQPTF